MQVVITDCDHGFFTPEEQIMDRAGYQLKIYESLESPELMEKIRDADAIICQRAPITREVLAALPNCRVVARYGVGVDNIDLIAAREMGVTVVYAPGFCTEEVAEQTLTLLLSLVRRPLLWDRKIREDVAAFTDSWDSRIERLKGIKRLRDVTLGIVGLGRIGSAVAERAQALGMRVIASDPHIPPAHFSQLGVSSVELDDLLATVDIVSLHVPLNPSTQSFFGEKQFRMMQPSANFINTCRGEVVDHAALLKALQENWIAGAALDVTYPEPLPNDHPFYRMDNVILTPHVSFYSDASIVLLKEQIATYVVNALSGEGTFPTPEL